jgi:hypothetical protein
MLYIFNNHVLTSSSQEEEDKDQIRLALSCHLWTLHIRPSTFDIKSWKEKDQDEYFQQWE